MALGFVFFLKVKLSLVLPNSLSGDSFLRIRLGWHRKGLSSSLEFDDERERERGERGEKREREGERDSETLNLQKVYGIVIRYSRKDFFCSKNTNHSEH